MEKRSFIPFDAETFLMIEDVTGTEPEVTEKENYFELKMYAPDKEERIIEAAIYAVQGRYGKRIKDARTIKEQNLLRGAIFFVEYEKGAENLPNELRTNLGMPDETAGDIYCRRLLEVRALPVKRDNWEKLQDVRKTRNLCANTHTTNRKARFAVICSRKPPRNTNILKNVLTKYYDKRRKRRSKKASVVPYKYGISFG